MGFLILQTLNHKRLQFFLYIRHSKKTIYENF